ncbi:hypothetical protein [Thetidibacter halocola]|uniref:Uncharacterized protein n=1 Tax=Thetidibacter halocola TaxID=2827239 RepID=A0A8J7WDF9_9RHOB|nr:hypothetical protein [Thetidibacter halocola]MBS0123311.1 hypothetical protein [Thetidibacter halocola]
MKHNEKSVSSHPPTSPGPRGVASKQRPEKPALEEPRAFDDSGAKIDRPGFDLGGSSGETHAGTGLGLGQDASDTAGDRRLPGRRPDNKLTIPRWGGPEPKGMTKPARKPSGRKT